MTHKTYIDVTSDKKTVYVWTRDANGKSERMEYPVGDFSYLYVLANGDTKEHMTDIYGRSVRKVSFPDTFKKREYQDTHENTMESDISPERRAMADLFCDAPQDIPLRVWFYDIEVMVNLESGLGFPTPSNPYGFVNCFQIYDCKEKRYIIIYVGDRDAKEIKDPDGYPVELIRVPSEQHLFDTVSDLMDLMDVDVLSPWFGNMFDLPYLMARAKMIYGANKSKTLFCRGDFRAKSREYVDEYGNDAVKWTLVGRQHVDLAELFKKFVPVQRRSFSLSSVCEDELGEDKVEYEGDLGELYKNDIDKFLYYAFQDVRLLKLLDEKRQLIRLAHMIAMNACVKLADVTSAVKVLEGDIGKYCHERNIVLPDKKENKKENYAGAIVYDTVNGKHDWVFSQDLTSLYPMSMVVLGLSPETIIAQCENEYEDYVNIMSRNDVYGDIKIRIERYGECVDTATLSPSELEASIRENGWTISANGTIFSGKDGVLASYILESFQTRKKYKDMMKEARRNGEEEKSKVYDLFQQVLKINLNSVYGVSANPYFVFYRIELAQSITLTAQMISKQQALVANQSITKIKEALA